MKIDWRVSTIVAGAAFVLSALIGLIGNVSFGALLVRALLSAAAFGAGAIGLRFVIDRFLPELLAASPPETEAEPGKSVDIVVDGEDDLTSEAALTDDAPLQDALDDGPEPADVDEVAVELPEANDQEESGEELPSVESMDDSFTEVPLAAESVEDVSQSGEDPAVMARAIRTVLNREE